MTTNNRPTPETDAAAYSNDFSREEIVLATFAQNLERQRDEARELARELRGVLYDAYDLLQRAGREDGTTWEPGQSWIFWEDKCTAKKDMETIRGTLTRAKEVLP